MSFREVDKKSTEMGRQMSTHEKSNSTSYKEGTPMMGSGYTELVDRCDSDWDELVDSGKASANPTAMETGPINRYSRKYHSNY